MQGLSRAVWLDRRQHPPQSRLQPALPMTLEVGLLRPCLCDDDARLCPAHPQHLPCGLAPRQKQTQQRWWQKQQRLAVFG
jgi:hypothetical protein